MKSWSITNNQQSDNLTYEYLTKKIEFPQIVYVISTKEYQAITTFALKPFAL